MTRRKRFRYIRDRLFLAVVVLYFLNRWLIKPLTVGEIAFFSSHFNDLICIPFCLPVVLWITRKVGLRFHDEPPCVYELGFYLLLWSFMFEYIAPMFADRLNNPVPDPWDVVCYAAGGIIAGLYWNFEIPLKGLSFNRAATSPRGQQ